VEIVKKRVLLYGWFGENNLGDELLLKACLDLVSSNANLECYVFGSNPKNIKNNHQVKVAAIALNGSIKRLIKSILYSFADLVKCLFFTDVLIIAGGGAISDWNYDSTKEMFFIIDWFNHKKKKIYLLGVGAGPITKEKPYGYFWNILSKSEVITVRDAYSKEQLEKIGLSNVKKSNDLVTYYETSCRKNTESDKVQKVGLVVVPVCQDTPEVYNKLIEEFRRLILKLSEKYNVTIIPFQYDYDIGFINAIKKNCHGVKIFNGDLWKTIDCFSNQDIIIGMRYHSLVLAIELEKLFIPIVYHPKSAELCKEYSIERYMCQVGNGENWIESNIDADDIETKINDLILDDEFIKYNNMILQGKRENNLELDIIKRL